MELIDRLLNTPEGGKLMAILLGLGLASLFRTQCIGDKCIIVRSIQDDFKNKRFKYTKSGVTKCVRFNTELTECKFKIEK
jgi:hypothetical protein